MIPSFYLLFVIIWFDNGGICVALTASLPGIEMKKGVASNWCGHSAVGECMLPPAKAAGGKRQVGRQVTVFMRCRSSSGVIHFHPLKPRVANKKFIFKVFIRGWIPIWIEHAALCHIFLRLVRNVVYQPAIVSAIVRETNKTERVSYDSHALFLISSRFFKCPLGGSVDFIPVYRIL